MCVDKDLDKIGLLKSGKVPIFEPGLEPMMVRNIKNGRLTFTNKIAEAIDGAEVIFIAVGTPPDEDGSADLKHVISVLKPKYGNIGGAKKHYACWN